MDEQQKKCMECQACCRYTLQPINPLNDHLKLLWLKNVPLMYNGKSKYWAMYVDSPCRYIDKEKGCLVYDRPDLKAEICGEYMCMQGDKTHMSDIKQGIAESRKLLDAMFEGDKDGDDISESD